MLKRPARATFGGAWVFPGGVLDAQDRNPALYRRCLAMENAAASRVLSVHRDGLAYWIAAIRETFEETGVLMAVNCSGQALRAAPGARRALAAGHAGFADLCRRGDWRFPARRLHYVAHWITPRLARRRFSTRFFVAAAPPGATARADGQEALRVRWFSPALALQGDSALAPPTRHLLRALSGVNSLDQALEWARKVGSRSVTAMRPEVRRINGKLMSCLPTGEVLGPFTMERFPASLRSKAPPTFQPPAPPEPLQASGSSAVGSGAQAGLRSAKEG